MVTFLMLVWSTLNALFSKDLVCDENKIYKVDPKANQIDSNIITLLHCSSICQSDDPISLVIYVFNHVDNFEKRQAIRSTWSYQMKLVFILGLSFDRTVNQNLITESKTYGDIVQGSFMVS